VKLPKFSGCIQPWAVKCEKHLRQFFRAATIGGPFQLDFDRAMGARTKRGTALCLLHHVILIDVADNESERRRVIRSCGDSAPCLSAGRGAEIISQSQGGESSPGLCPPWYPKRCERRLKAASCRHSAPILYVTSWVVMGNIKGARLTNSGANSAINIT
jgi:hypothetical protein